MARKGMVIRQLNIQNVMRHSPTAEEHLLKTMKNLKDFLLEHLSIQLEKPDQHHQVLLKSSVAWFGLERYGLFLQHEV